MTSINYLVVGGGGGGGGDSNNNGGGGGGGLLRYAENQPISTGTYPVVVGAGVRVDRMVLEMTQDKDLMVGINTQSSFRSNISW